VGVTTQSDRLVGLASDIQTTTSTWQRKHVTLLFASLAAIYILCAWIHYSVLGVGGSQHFIYLADGWLHGQLYLHDTPPNPSDYTFYHGHWYVAFPPLPAVLLLPLVAIFLLSYQGIISLLFSLGMGILNIWLMLNVLKRFSQRQTEELSFASVAWLMVLFALGTEHLYATLQGNVWYIAHIVATTFLLLYTGETLGKQRPIVAGIYLGLAALSRGITLLAFPFFVVLTLSAFLARRRKGERYLTPARSVFRGSFFGVLGVFLVGMLIYNQARFSSLLDFGYTTMNVNHFVSGNLHAYGQFSPHFIRTNLHYMLINPPFTLSHGPYLSFSPMGTGIFWTTPALLFVFLAFWRKNKEQRWLPAALLLACLLPMSLLLMYFNTGWYQFGYRFVLDFLPFALLLAASGMQGTPTWCMKLLIVLSVAINFWGLWAFTFFRP